MDDAAAIFDSGLGWLEAYGPDADIVLSSRVRLARNLQGHPYVARASDGQREVVCRTVARAFEKTSMRRRAVLLRMTEMSERARKVLLERRLISREIAGLQTGPDGGVAVAIAGDGPVSVLINEEDHLRLQGLVGGLRVADAWSMVDRLDEELGRGLHFAYHHEFGYLTCCPTNVGTGLRASALLHLPGLVLTKEIARALQGISEVGLTFRGLHGEGSEVVGNFFQISNQTTLGQSEEDLVEHLTRIVTTVLEKERRARQVLLRDAGPVTEDKVWRAYGLLRHARALEYEELMNLLSGVRLGVSLQLLPSPSVYSLNRIMILSQAAHLEEAAGRVLTSPERRAHRAEYVRRVLAAGDPPTSDPGE